MNSFTAISLVYWLMALGSVGVLSFTFRNNIDTSGKLFLLAEISVLPTFLIIGLSHVDPAYKNGLLVALANATYLLSEIFICASIYSLSRNLRLKSFLMGMLYILIVCGLTEFMRVKAPQIPTLLYPVWIFCIALVTYKVCVTCDIPELNGNPFFNWIKFIEAVLLVISALRIAAFFIAAPVTPFSSDVVASTFLAVMAALNISRYIAYLALRISWIGPGGVKENFLNRSLAQTAQEKERLLENLINSNRILGISALASSLAHELSQPLTSAALQTEAIKRDLASAKVDASFIAAMNNVSRQINTLSDLVKNLRRLFAAKNEGFRPFSLREISDEILALVMATKKSKAIDFGEDYQSDPIVHGNPVQIQQVMINLIDNAIEAMDLNGSPRKEIRIAIDETEGFARLTLEDNGGGIHEDILPLIFDLYKTTKSEGLGVGLWLSKTIIDNHNGAIAAANKPGGGASFEIRLPLAERTP